MEGRISVIPRIASPAARPWTLYVSATAWAAALSLTGAWLWLDAALRWPVAFMPCRVGGVTAMASGQLVFMCFVADRAFPGAPRRFVRVIEGFAAVLAAGGGLWLAVVAAGAIFGVL